MSSKPVPAARRIAVLALATVGSATFSFAGILFGSPQTVTATAIVTPPPVAELSIATIMARDWIGTPPSDPYWSDDGRSVYYSQRRPASDIVDRHRVDLSSGRDTVVEAGALVHTDYPGVWSADRKTKAWLRDGDLWARSGSRTDARQITRTSATESSPLPLDDGRIAFRRGDLFLAFDPASGRTDTVAELRFGRDPEAAETPEGFLAAEERRLFRVLAERAGRKAAIQELEHKRRTSDPTLSPRPFYFAEDRELRDALLSPSGRHLLLVLGAKRDSPVLDAQGAEGGRSDEMATFVNDSGYVESKKIRPKVGTGAPKSPELVLLNLTTGARHALDLGVLPGIADDPLTDLRRIAGERKKGAARSGTASDSGESSPAERTSAPAVRTVEFNSAAWSDRGEALAVQLLSHDNKDRWIATIDLVDGALRPLYRQNDPAWLGWRFTEFGWSRDARALWYLSEESGYSHLYLQVLGGDRYALTQGPFEVDQPRLARDGRSFLVTANREQAGIWEVYRVSAAGGPLERLSSGGGISSAILSPDEKQLLLTSSTSTMPPELFVQPARSGVKAKRLTHSSSAEFDAVRWVAPEIVQVPSTHFAGTVQARLYDLPEARPARGAPAVLFVHGAGYLQNAHAGWSSYFREFMFHTLLARAGYVVLDMDYRASAGYGRDHRTAIYRQMGGPEVEDLADGVDWLVTNRGVDRARVGVYGGSYGGFLTFMSMFKKPEIFAAGAALRPVSDWAHYNHSYTSAILNTPELDPEAYLRSSPIAFAEGLARPLLICHGMVDDNVTFQDTVRLVQRLIELGKTDLFETAIYPVEAHAFTEPSSWTDEYRRIWNLFEAELKPAAR